MKIIVFLAMSINGLIAHKNEGEDFLSSENWKTLRMLVEKYRTLVVGRRTYEIVNGWGPDYSFGEFKKTRKYVLSTGNSFQPNPEFEKVGSVESMLRISEKAKIKNLLIIGGSRTVTSFMEGNYVDEIIVNIEPVLVGSGKPMTCELPMDHRLKLIRVNRLKDGLLNLHYKVIGKRG